jgi:hypothetical protein
MVIPKPRKPVSAQETAGSWRPISLLSTVGKAIEFVMASQITTTAEAAGLLPEGQIGNRPHVYGR